MKATELLDAGRLAALVELLNQEVRAHPADAKLRTFLFEALCFAGDYDRAQRQLDALEGLNAQLESGIAIYRKLLSAERSRLAVANENQLPVFLLELPAFASLYIAALHRLREGNAADARALLMEGMEQQPAATGQIDGQKFSDFSDADPFLGPFLEVIVNEQYAWVPFVQIKRFKIDTPKHLRDLLWVPATLETVGGPSGTVLLPVLYGGSFRYHDEQVCLGRATEWEEVGENLVRGRGQRMFVIDEAEKPMLQCHEIEFDYELTSLENPY